MERMLKIVRYRLLYVVIVVALFLVSGKVISKSIELILSSEGKQMIVTKLDENINLFLNTIMGQLFIVQSENGNVNFIEKIVAEVMPNIVYVNNYIDNENDEQNNIEYEVVSDYFFEDNKITEGIENLEEKTEIEEIKTTTEIVANIEKNEIRGRTYSLEQLSDYNFLLENFYIVDSTTSVTKEELNAKNLLSKDLTVDFTGDELKILIYHTHGSENFIDSEEGEIGDTIIGIGDELTKILEEQYGMNVYHDRTVYDIVDGKLDRNKAYTMSGYGIEKILAEYPSIEVIIDLHRDGLSNDTRLITEIDGETVAKIMFFNGVSRTAKNGDIDYLQNEYKQDNLAFSLQMQLEAKRLYEDFVRKIYIKGYRYNMQFRPRSLLIESGAETNTVQEEKNAMKYLAKILYNVLSGNTE